MKRSPIRRRRKKPRPGRLSSDGLDRLRNRVWTEQGGRCITCGKKVTLEGDLFHRMHLAHIRNKRMFGDGRDNVQGKCFDCHSIKEHQYGPSRQKPCPPKPKKEEVEDGDNIITRKANEHS